jgi:BirA family biotin operon repressor/biotin-[acetyl-CoA-carboxylase] ligase
LRSPLESGPLVVVESATSTQDLASDWVRRGEASGGAVLALWQTDGRGRFSRSWFASKGESLAASFVFPAYADSARPWLIGMGVALAAANVFQCQLRWPNDLIVAGRKLGGVLTEIVSDPAGRRVPIVGLGVNLNQRSLPPEIADFATSIRIEHGVEVDPRSAVERVIARLDLVPEPDAWERLAGPWSEVDVTTGSKYRLPDGTTGTAVGIGIEGELLCLDESGREIRVLAAEAWFGGPVERV